MKNYIMKVVSVLTLFFFSISNLSYAGILTKDESALRGASLAVSETKSSIEAVFASKTPSKTITWPLELDEILDRILEKAGMVIGKDVFINRNRDWVIDETGHKEEAVKIARLLKEGAKFGRLLIHTDFEIDFNDIKENDVVLKVNFGDGVTREISVARGLCYRAFGAMFNWQGKDGGHLRKPQDEGELLWVEDEKEASRVGARYRIINSAIWVWYHFLFKNKDERVRNNNKFASEVLDIFFEVVNNYKKYEQSEDEQLRNIINFREQIPFLLIEDENLREKTLELQNKVKKLVLIINALYFKIPETIPEPISLNLFDPALEHFFKGYWQSTDATVGIFQGYAGKYGKIQYEKTRINKLGFKAYITDEGKALIVRDNQLIIAEPPDVVENGVGFSDDARFLVCIGSKSIKVYNLFSPDKPVVTQNLTGGFCYEFFNKDKTGLYNYIILSTWLEKERVRITVYHLHSGKLMIDEVTEEKQGVPLYRLLGDGRYVELKAEEKLITGVTASYLYDLKYSTTPAMRLFPIVTIYKGNLPPVVGDIRFNTDVITEVSYGEADKRISFNPKTAQVVSPKLIDPEEVYDDVGPDIPESFFYNIGMPVNVTRHKGYAAVFQLARFDDKIFEDKVATAGDRIRADLGVFYKVTIFNQEGKPVIGCNYPVRKFWFSPDGKYVVFYNYNREVEIVSLKNPSNSIGAIGPFFRLKDVRFTKDNQHIIFYDRTTSKVWNIKYLEGQGFSYYLVATLNRKEPSHFRFFTYTAEGTKRLLIRCKDAEEITIDRKTAEVVDISMPEPEERPGPEVEKKEVEKAGSAEMLIEESSEDEPSAKSSSAGKTTTAEVYKMLIKASDKKIAELLRTLHTRKFRMRDITPYRTAAKIISDKAAGDIQKATQLIDGFARHIKILTKNRLSGVAVNYELGERTQILTFNDRGWKFYTREEWKRKLSSWNYFPIDATDGMGIYYPSDESSARQISYFKSKDPYEYETEPEFAWVRSPVNFTELNIGLPKPLEAIIFISAAKSSSAGEVKVGGFDFKVITDNEAFSSSVGPLTTVLKNNLSILRRRTNFDLKFPDLSEHKQVVFTGRGVFFELIKIPGSYPDAYLIIAAIEGEKGQGIKQLAILVQERGQEAETYEIPCVKVFIIQPSIAQIENLGKKLATSATEEKKALSRYLKYLKQQTAAKSSSAGNNVSLQDVPDSLLKLLGITRDRITTAMTNSRGYFIIIENSTGRQGDDLVDIVSPDGKAVMREGPVEFSSSPDNRYVAFVRRDNFLFDVYDLYSPTPTEPIIREATPDEFQKFQINFSPDNRHLLCASFWKGVCEQYAVYDLQNSKESIIKYDPRLSPLAGSSIKVYFDSTGANLIVQTIKEGRLGWKTVPIPQKTTVAKSSSAGNIDSEVVSIDANGGTIKPDSLGVGAQRDEQVKKKIEEALNISKTLVDITAVKSLLLDEQAKLDRLNPIIIAVPDTYMLCPGLREFAESVKDLTTISREPLFQFVVSVDASLPDSDELKELISKVNEAGIIEAKVKMIRALEIPNLRKIIPITTSQAEQPVNATELLIEQLKQSDNIMTMATKRRLIIFQHPQVVTDQNQQIREELEKLAERNGVFIVLPVTDFDKKDKLFDVNSLMLAFLGSLKYTSALSVSAPVLRGMLMIGLPEIKSEDVEKKAEEFHRAILKTLASA